MNDNKKGVFASVAQEERPLPLMFELYGLRDVKSGVFMPPLMFRNKAECLRNVGYLVKNDQLGDAGKFPQDYQLWQLGVFEIDTGRLVGKLEFVIDVSALLG